jgi:hypothetical protein
MIAVCNRVSSSIRGVELLLIRDFIFRLYRMVHAMNHEKQPTFALCPVRNSTVVMKALKISPHDVEVIHPLQPSITAIHYDIHLPSILVTP